jgi:hypothetical protein
MLKKIQPHRPKVSREVYTLQSISRAWPDGAWVEELAELEDDAPSPAVLEPAGEVPVPSITIIGGDTFDLEAVMAAIPLDHRIIVGAGRGLESTLAKLGGDEVFVVQPDPDRFKKPMDVNVEQTLTEDISSTLVIVGNGTRAKQAKSWVKRAEWPREVVLLP